MKMNLPSLQCRALFFALAVPTITSCTVSPQQEVSMGAHNATIIEQQVGVERTQQMAEYVSQVGQRLVEQLEHQEFEYHFAVLDDPTPNAFALPGGYIFISRGLLALMNSEDELACVLAHEIIHVSEHHSVKQMKSSILPSLIELPGNIVGGVVNENLGALINAPISLSNSLFSAKYSRTHESEADRLGIALAAKAGYQPEAMADILARMNDAVEMKMQQKIEKSYFDSHPYTPDRVATIQDKVPRVQVAEQAPVQVSFVSMLDGLLYGENPAKGVFHQQTFLHPTMDFAIDFPKGWSKDNQPQGVLAINKDQTAMVGLTMASSDYTASEHAVRFETILQERYGYKAKIESYDYDWGSKGYSITLPTKANGAESSIKQQWVEHDGNVFRLFGYSPNEALEMVDTAMSSFSPLNEAQRNQIMAMHIRVVNPEHKHIMLTAQSELPESKEMLLLMNGVTQDKELENLPKVKTIEESVWQLPEL